MTKNQRYFLEKLCRDGWLRSGHVAAKTIRSLEARGLAEFCWRSAFWKPTQLARELVASEGNKR